MEILTLEEELASKNYFIGFDSSCVSYLKGITDISLFISIDSQNTLRFSRSVVQLMTTSSAMKIVTYKGLTYMLKPVAFKYPPLFCYFVLEPL